VAPVTVWAIFDPTKADGGFAYGYVLSYRPVLLGIGNQRFQYDWTLSGIGSVVAFSYLKVSVLRRWMPFW
jgi:hypothetical protein